MPGDRCRTPGDPIASAHGPRPNAGPSTIRVIERSCSPPIDCRDHAPPARFRSLGALLLSRCSSLGLAAADADGKSRGHRAEQGHRLPAAGPLGAVTVVGDSVLLGSALWSPTLPDQLQAYGWGPIRFRAGVGDKAGPTGSTSTAG